MSADKGAPRLGLALSGGGFRATLYHLGVIRFLKDANKLQQVTDIASVSGGSILAAHLALNWDRYTGDETNFETAASEVLEFVRLDIRNKVVRRLPLQIPLWPLTKLRLLESRSLTSNAILEGYYKRHLYGDRCLYELPERPLLHILTTNVSTGLLAVFNRDGLIIQRRGDDGSSSFEAIPGRMASIPRVVAASSAFPGFFPPVEITAADLGIREGEFPAEFFTDGGVYDNMGLRAFLWLQAKDANFEHVLVSDAGKPFQMLTDASLGFVGQSVRAADILWDRVWQLEREIFGNQAGFVFLPITKTVALAEDPTALHPVVQTEVQSIRTDLDRFSVREINALVQHGYEVARNVCTQQGLISAAETPSAAPWAPIAGRKTTSVGSPDVTSTEASKATLLSRQLRGSSRRRVWSTLLDWRDWPSYLYVAAAVLLLVVMPYQVYKLYQRAQTQAAIIESISSGDPDIRQILTLANSNPVSDWVSEEIEEVSEPAKLDYEGIEVLTHSRIYDLRWWRPEGSMPDPRGLVYVRDRITLKLLRSYSGDGRITFALPSKVEEVEFRHPNQQLRGSIRRIVKPMEVRGETRTLYELEYDLSEVLPEEPVTIELEALLRFPNTARTQFVTALNTDLISVWILFGPDRPSGNYSLLSYPVDRSVPPEKVNVRYSIKHPDGSLIGWSVVNPKVNYVYECRWTAG